MKIKMIAGTGTGPIDPAPKTLYHAGRDVNGKPFDRSAAAPYRTFIIASVMMNVRSEERRVGKEC